MQSLALKNIIILTFNFYQKYKLFSIRQKNRTYGLKLQIDSKSNEIR